MTYSLSFLLFHALVVTTRCKTLSSYSNQENRGLRRSRSDGNGYFLCGPDDSEQVYCVIGRQVCVIDNGTNVNSCDCIQGWGGANCLVDIDECSLDYPCPGGNEASYCVNMFMPVGYKCQCRPGFTAILSNTTDGVIPADFRPLACLPTTDGEMTSKPPASVSIPVTTSPTKAPPAGTCKSTTDCQGFLNNNFLCSVSGTCVCKSGYFKVSSNCQDKNECKDEQANNCHRNAECFNLPGSYFCRCKDGYADVDTSARSGTNCRQSNECLLGTHDCNSTEICVDRTPPTKWECVDPTPVPTPAPTIPLGPTCPCLKEDALLGSELNTFTFCNDRGGDIIAAIGTKSLRVTNSPTASCSIIDSSIGSLVSFSLDQTLLAACFVEVRRIIARGGGCR